MEKVTYLNLEGEVVNLGDVMHLTEHKQTRFGALNREEWIKVTEDSIPHLIKKGVLTVRKEKEKKANRELTASLIISKIANHLQCSTDEAISFLATVVDLNPTAFLNIVAKKIAVELDKKYPDHISKSEHIFVIDAVTGNIVEIKKNNVLWKSFAAFRTAEDALKAVNIMSELASRLDVD